MGKTQVLRDIWEMQRERVLIIMSAVERMRSCGLTFLRQKNKDSSVSQFSDQAGCGIPLGHYGSSRWISLCQDFYAP